MFSKIELTKYLQNVVVVAWITIFAIKCKHDNDDPQTNDKADNNINYNITRNGTVWVVTTWVITVTRKIIVNASSIRAGVLISVTDA